jgi:hypothetical protein
MQYIPLGASAYDGNAYGFPSIVLENWFAEEAGERNDRPYRLIPTPGLTSFATGLNGAVRGMFQTDGIESGKAFVCAGLRVHSITSAGVVAEVGTVTGTDEARFAASQSDLVMTAGGTAYVVTSSLASITISGASGNIIDCAEIAQRHLFLEEGTGRFWFSDVADPSTVPATSFATAESEPDQLYAIRVVGDLVYLFGSRTVEIWEYTGSDALPFRPISAAIDAGVVARGAIAQGDFGLFAVGRDSSGNEVVYAVNGGGIQRVSTHPIERLIEDVTEANRASIRLTSHGWGGHTFIGLHLPGIGDYFYDIGGRTWHRRRELNATRYLAGFFFAAWGERFAGDLTAGTVYRMDRNVYTHNSNAVRRVASTIIPIEDGRPTIDNLTVELQGGVGLTTGQGSDPQVMLRWAEDGIDWGNEVTRSFGKEGERNYRAYFGSLGRFVPPAMAIEIAVADPVAATVTGLSINRVRA